MPFIVGCVCLQGYLKALGMARTAQVKRDARMGEAEARRDAGIRVRQRHSQHSHRSILQDSILAFIYIVIYSITL